MLIFAYLCEKKLNLNWIVFACWIFYFKLWKLRLKFFHFKIENILYRWTRSTWSFANEKFMEIFKFSSSLRMKILGKFSLREIVAQNSSNDDVHSMFGARKSKKILKFYARHVLLVENSKHLFIVDERIHEKTINRRNFQILYIFFFDVVRSVFLSNFRISFKFIPQKIVADKKRLFRSQNFFYVYSTEIILSWF